MSSFLFLNYSMSTKGMATKCTLVSIKESQLFYVLQTHFVRQLSNSKAEQIVA